MSLFRDVVATIGIGLNGTAGIPGVLWMEAGSSMRTAQPNRRLRRPCGGITLTSSVRAVAPSPRRVIRFADHPRHAAYPIHATKPFGYDNLVHFAALQNSGRLREQARAARRHRDQRHRTPKQNARLPPPPLGLARGIEQVER
jgi:hypothetical protein